VLWCNPKPAIRGSINAWVSVLVEGVEGCAAKSGVLYVKASNTTELT
jgi:hypothetical protein